MNNSTIGYIEKEKKCFYLDGNSQPAHHMLRTCVGEESELEYPCSMNTTSLVHSNLILNRGLVENNISNSVVEGFTTDNGLGESTIPQGQCPEGYKRCPTTGKCIQVCIHCKYRDGYKSQYMNEYDPCFPEGIYNGRDNQGGIKCTCGLNNQYCNYKRNNNLFMTDGSLIIDKQFIPVIGNYKQMDKLYSVDNL